MSVSNNILKLMGVAFAFVGFLLILGAVGVHPFGTTISLGHPVLSVIAGVAFMWGGYVMIKGGVPTL